MLFYVHFCPCSNEDCLCQKLKLVQSSMIPPSHIVLLTHTVVLNTAFPKLNAGNLHADSIRENGQILLRLNIS